MLTVNSSLRPSYFLDAGGEMGALIGAKDWSSTPLGALEQWPQSLRTAVVLMLRMRRPVLIAWGSQLISLYNDACLPIWGEERPALGLPLATLWREVWDSLEPAAAAALRGEAPWTEARYLARGVLLHSKAGPSEPALRLDLSVMPIFGEDGSVAGIFCEVTALPNPRRFEQPGKSGKNNFVSPRRPPRSDSGTST